MTTIVDKVKFVVVRRRSPDIKSELSFGLLDRLGRLAIKRSAGLGDPSSADSIFPGGSGVS
jgi:hypothetical protein